MDIFKDSRYCPPVSQFGCRGLSIRHPTTTGRLRRQPHGEYGAPRRTTAHTAQSHRKQYLHGDIVAAKKHDLFSAWVVPALMGYKIQIQMVVGHKRAEAISEDCWHKHSMHAGRPGTEARTHLRSALLGSSPESARRAPRSAYLTGGLHTREAGRKGIDRVRCSAQAPGGSRRCHRSPPRPRSGPSPSHTPDQPPTRH